MFDKCRREEKCLNHPQRCPSCHACADLMNPYPLFKDKDVVEVVRCKDCEYCDQYYPKKEIGKEASLVYNCLQIGRTAADGFCSFGKRKGGSDGPQ